VTGTGPVEQRGHLRHRHRPAGRYGRAAAEANGPDHLLAGADDPLAGADDPLAGADDPLAGADDPLTGAGGTSSIATAAGHRRRAAEPAMWCKNDDAGVSGLLTPASDDESRTLPTTAPHIRHRPTTHSLSALTNRSNGIGLRRRIPNRPLAS